MILNSDLQSVVRLDDMYFDRINFARSGADIPSKNLKLHFTKSYKFGDSGHSCLVALGCNVYDDSKESLSLEISVVGSFFCDEESPDRRDALLRKNTIAILFPYLRTQISVVTMQPGLSPIILPPMNIEALFAEAEEK